MEGLENPQRFQLKAFRHLEKNTMTTERSKKNHHLPPTRKFNTSPEKGPFGCFQNRGTSKWMVYNGNPIKMDDLGGKPLFSETPISNRKFHLPTINWHGTLVILVSLHVDQKDPVSAPFLGSDFGGVLLRQLPHNGPEKTNPTKKNGRKIPKLEKHHFYSFCLFQPGGLLSTEQVRTSLKVMDLIAIPNTQCISASIYSYI